MEDDEATGRRSLFCALEKACIDVLGTYDHAAWRYRKSDSPLRMRRAVGISNIG
jgi:hypothetical protein